ncbi:MAG: hypothetical protein ACREMZ_16275 [Gemmatimonadales bacterium]
MSYAVKVSKAQYRGDPGLFSFVGKALGGIANVVSKVVPGPIGAIAGLAGKVLAGNGKPQNPSIAKAAPIMPAINVASAFPVLQAAPQLPQQGNQYGLVNINRPQLPAMPMGPGNQTQSGFGGQSQNGAACQSGYHRNKSGYYSQRYGWVPAGSVCVKNRRRNPLNPRAASRAMSRLTSARKATRSIQKFFGGPRPSSAPARKGPCGCKGRR